MRNGEMFVLGGGNVGVWLAKPDGCQTRDVNVGVWLAKPDGCQTQCNGSLGEPKKKTLTNLNQGGLR